MELVFANWLSTDGLLAVPQMTVVTIQIKQESANAKSLSGHSEQHSLVQLGIGSKAESTTV